MSVDADREAGGPSAEGAGVLARLRDAGLLPRRRLGQHFLHDPSLLSALVVEAGVQPHERVLEVGAGPGTLTRELASAAAEVLAVDVDGALLAFAREELAAFSNVRFLHADVLGRGTRLAPELVDSLRRLEPFVWVSNLPYSIATTLILLLAESDLRWDRGILMVQHEVASRLVAAPGEREYGPLTALLAYWFRKRLPGRRVPAGAFWPPPRVDSRTVRLEGRQPLGSAQEYASYRAWVKALFAHRRQQLGRLLRERLGREGGRAALAEAGWSAETRPERLLPADYLWLARRFPCQDP